MMAEPHQEALSAGGAAAGAAAAASPQQKRQVILSWSGGKDSAMTLHALLNSEEFEVVGLLVNVVVPESAQGNEEDEDEGDWRISSHGVRRRLLQAQVAALQRPLPILEARVSARPRNGEYEAAVFAALREALRRFPALVGVAYGDLFLADIKAYREGMLARFPDRALEAIFPLWGLETGGLARQLIALGFRARLVCVDTTQLASCFAGREYDAALLAELAALGGGVDPCLEKGEAHTFVYDGPIFARPVRVVVVEPGSSSDSVAAAAAAAAQAGDGRFVYCDLVPAAAAAAVES
jgi:uncharacterized protein (TIGR00290 family)